VARLTQDQSEVNKLLQDFQHEQAAHLALQTAHKALQVMHHPVSFSATCNVLPGSAASAIMSDSDRLLEEVAGMDRLLQEDQCLTADVEDGSSRNNIELAAAGLGLLTVDRIAPHCLRVLCLTCRQQPQHSCTT
jgi:hypothetical protein